MLVSRVVPADLPIDPNEPLYCYCQQVSYGEMVACDSHDVRNNRITSSACNSLIYSVKLNGSMLLVLISRQYQRVNGIVVVVKETKEDK